MPCGMPCGESPLGSWGPRGADICSSAAARSPALSGASRVVVSAMRRDHSRTLPCMTKRSRSWAMSTSATIWAMSTATTEAAISRPNSDCGHSRSRRERLLAFDADADDIALAVDGLDDLRSAGIVTENLPQPTDAHIDAAVEGIGVAPAQKLGELRAVEYAVARRQQHRQQPILRAAERCLRAGRIGQRARHRVELPAPEPEAPHLLGIRVARGVGAAPEDRLDPAEELARIEGLGHIVVGPELQPHDPVHILAARGEHDDG